VTSHKADTLGIVVRGVSAIDQAVFCTVLTPEERTNLCGIEFETRKPSERAVFVYTEEASVMRTVIRNIR